MSPWLRIGARLACVLLHELRLIEPYVPEARR
jgi:hypothetical protein